MQTERYAALASLPGLRGELSAIDVPTAKFDLSLTVAEQGGSIHAGFEYSTDLFDAGTIERLAAHYERLLSAALAAPQVPLQDLPLLTAEEAACLCAAPVQTLAQGADFASLWRQSARRFPAALIVRLPALFGPGLKKNVVFDMLHENRLDLVHQDGRFQFYDLAHLTADIARAEQAGLTLLNLASEPLTTQDVARAYNAQCTPDFFGFNGSDELQYRGRLDASRMSPLPNARRDLYEAMKQIAETGQGPREQIPSMGCSVKWRA